MKTAPLTQLKKRIKKGKFFYFETKISEEKYEKLMQLGDKSIEPRDNLIRIYPQKNLFSHIIGQIDNDNNGISGLEKSLDNELIFKCNGSFANVEISRSELNGSLDYKVKPDIKKIVQGVFSLKNLSYFIKCTPLCNQIELYLENDLPLIVQYHIGSLGIIKLCLSPLPSDNLL